MTLSYLYQEGKSALLRAAGTGNISAVKRELSGHTDVNSQDEVGSDMSLQYLHKQFSLCNYRMV